MLLLLLKKQSEKEKYLVAVIVVTGNVDFRLMCRIADKLRSCPDLENRTRIPEEAANPATPLAEPTRLS
jgi:hypothetical protein